MKILGDESSEKKQYKTWSKSTKANDVTKEIKVEEIENGFLVCTNVYGYKDGKYEDDYKKYYSKTNPLTEIDLVKNEGVVDAISDFLKEL